MGLLNDLHEDDGHATLAEIGASLGVSRERARQLQASAIRKVRIGFALEELLGNRAAAPILESLRGRALPAFQRALKEARGGRT